MSGKQPLKGKRVLLVSLPGYHKGIVKQMQELGAKVSHINDKPNEGFLCKSLGRLQIGFYQKRINQYYYKKTKELENNDYDYILVIRGEYTPVGALKCLKKSFASAKLILYMWDGLHKQNTKGIEDKWKYYDRVYTFDRIDYEENKDRIDFLPLYYYDEYIPSEVREYKLSDYKYDVSFIGTGHADRVKIVKEIMKQCGDEGMRTYMYIFMPHIFVFFINKMINKDFKNVTSKEINYRMVPFEKLYKVYAKSKCIVDVENPGQHGLTMRSIEMLGLRRKFITTNKDIVNYDFYNSNNILVIDRNDPVIDFSFFQKPYETLASEIYEKYSLSNWIVEVLK